mgnify:FL=1
MCEDDNTDKIGMNSMSPDIIDNKESYSCILYPAPVLS